jgi:hypothetical protein
MLHINKYSDICELERIGEEVVMVYFKVSLGVTENHRTPQSG